MLYKVVFDGYLFASYFRSLIVKEEINVVVVRDTKSDTGK